MRFLFEGLNLKKVKSFFFLTSCLFAFSCSVNNTTDDLVEIKRLIGADEIDSAKSKLIKIIALDSVNVSAMLLLSDACLMQEDYKEADQLLKKCFEIDSTIIDLNLKMSQLALFKGDYNDVIAKANNVLKQDRTTAKAYYLKGAAYKFFGDTVRSVSNFKTVIEQDPDFIDAYVALGEYYSNLKPHLAIQYFNNALLIKPNDRHCLYMKSLALIKTKDFVQSREISELLNSRYPDDKEVIYNLGYLALQLEDYDLAVQNFSQLYRVDSLNVKYNYMLGYAYSKIGEYRKAEKFLKKSKSIDSTFVDKLKE